MTIKSAAFYAYLMLPVVVMASIARLIRRASLGIGRHLSASFSGSEGVGRTPIRGPIRFGLVTTMAIGPRRP
jgi:hypothetical protein